MPAIPHAEQLELALSNPDLAATRDRMAELIEAYTGGVARGYTSQTWPTSILRARTVLTAPRWEPNSIYEYGYFPRALVPRSITIEPLNFTLPPTGEPV